MPAPDTDPGPAPDTDPGPAPDTDPGPAPDTDPGPQAPPPPGFPGPRNKSGVTTGGGDGLAHCGGAAFRLPIRASRPPVNLSV